MLIEVFKTVFCFHACGMIILDGSGPLCNYRPRPRPLPRPRPRPLPTGFPKSHEHIANVVLMNSIANSQTMQNKITSLSNRRGLSKHGIQGLGLGILLLRIARSTYE
jgi:hypothetical protein